MSKYFVSNKDESVRMFKSDFLDFFTRVHWSIPLIIFVPVIFYFLYEAAFVKKITYYDLILLFLFGAFLWTITEYSMHRFIFHFHPKGEKAQRFFWTFHGVHHDYPQDSKRLVMVPSVSIPLAAIYYILFYYVFGAHYVSAIFAGFMTGYLFYDMTHYAIHHYGFKNKFWLYLKQYHMTHHYRFPDKGFGVSSPLWDKVFGTGYPKKK